MHLRGPYDSRQQRSLERVQAGASARGRAVGRGGACRVDGDGSDHEGALLFARVRRDDG